LFFDQRLTVGPPLSKLFHMESCCCGFQFVEPVCRFKFMFYAPVLRSRFGAMSDRMSCDVFSLVVDVFSFCSPTCSVCIIFRQP